MKQHRSEGCADAEKRDNSSPNFSIANMSMLPATFGASLVGAVQAKSRSYAPALIIFLGITVLMVLLDFLFHKVSAKKRG